MSGSTWVDTEVGTEQQGKMRSSPSYHVTIRSHHSTSASSDGWFSVGLEPTRLANLKRAGRCPGPFASVNGAIDI